MDNVRILTGWTKEERKELKDIENNQRIATMVIFEICNEYLKGDNLSHPALYRKYDASYSYEDDQLAKDIADYMNGDAKFPDKKYILDMSVDCAKGYVKHISAVKTDSWVKTTLSITFTPKRDNAAVLTEQEIKDIDPRYMQFAVEYAGEDND